MLVFRLTFLLYGGHTLTHLVHTYEIVRDLAGEATRITWTAVEGHGEIVFLPLGNVVALRVDEVDLTNPPVPSHTEALVGILHSGA